MLFYISAVVLPLIALFLVHAQDPLLPWETNPEYYRALEKGLKLDLTPHHVHFVDQGKYVGFRSDF